MLSCTQAFQHEKDVMEEANVDGTEWCGVKEKHLLQDWMVDDGWRGRTSNCS